MANVTRAVPLRILCIHGYRQNGSSFREKTGALRKLLKKQVEWVFMNAPHCVLQVSDGVLHYDLSVDLLCIYNAAVL